MDKLQQRQSDIIVLQSPPDADCLDDWLQRLLSVLAEVSDWEGDNEKRSENKNQAALPNLPAPKLECNLITIAWQTLETSFPHESSSATTKTNHIWWTGWKLLASEILHCDPPVFPFSPTRLHATATISSLPLSKTQAFTATCLLLSCHALKRIDSSALIRTKRWRSIVLETIRGFQQQQQSRKGSLDPVNASYLFCHCMIPAMEYALPMLLSQGTVPNDSKETRTFTTTFRAAVVQCLATLALHIDPTEQNIWQTQFWLVLSRISPAHPTEWLATHFWRQHHRGFILNHAHIDDCFDSQDDTVHLMTQLTTFSDDMSNDDDDMSKKMEEEDTFSGVVDTQWPVLGIAHLISSDACVAGRPCVWSPLYQWHLFFPSFVTRMGAELEIDNQIHESNKLCERLCGFLYQIPRHTLICPRKEHIPCFPFPVFQWLVNAMVKCSQKDASYSDRTSSTSASTHFAMMNELMQRYRPESQIYIITTHLYPRCPYPVVQPKIVDLLRPYHQWPTKVLQERVWSFVETVFVQGNKNIVEEIQIALLSLLEVVPPGNLRERLERIELSLETTEKQLLAFTLDRIKKRLLGCV